MDTYHENLEIIAGANYEAVFQPIHLENLSNQTLRIGTTHIFQALCICKKGKYAGQWEFVLEGDSRTYAEDDLYIMRKIN